MKKVAVVILNYLNYKDTIECVESLEKVKYKEKEIIIVDNYSKNESWEVLNNKFKNTTIHLLQSNENLGFSKGNNIGIEYATETLQCKYVLLVNNDTIFTDENFLKILMDSYEENVAVIGPRIIAANDVDQNPVPTVVNKEKIYEEYKIYKSFKYRFLKSEFYTSLKKIKILNNANKALKKKLGKNNSTYKKEISDNIVSEELVLHGACMLLTEDYFKYYPKLLPDTFLYYEENILTLITKKVGLKKKFINNTSIYHKEDQSSEMSFNNLNKVKMKYLIESMKICENIFELGYNEIMENYFKK